MLENYNNREYVETANEKITIEHIFPRNPNEDWLDILSNDELNNFKDKYLNTIGNLTLSGNNGALSNKGFIEKKDMNINGGEQGYVYSRMWLNDYLKSIDTWTSDEYFERQKIIYERFLKIWEYPNVDISKFDIYDEENIFDAIFEHQYYSSEMGMRKPNSDCFQSVLEKSSLDPFETLFIDDSIQHVQGARKLKIKA